MNDGDEFTFPIDRSALTPEHWGELKRFAVGRARAERSKAIRATMTWLLARLRGIRAHVASGAVSSREAVARAPAPRGQAERI